MIKTNKEIIMSNDGRKPTSTSQYTGRNRAVELLNDIIIKKGTIFSKVPSKTMLDPRAHFKHTICLTAYSSGSLIYCVDGPELAEWFAPVTDLPAFENRKVECVGGFLESGDREDVQVSGDCISKPESQHIKSFQLMIDPIPDWFMDEVSASRVILDTDRNRCSISTGSGCIVAVKGDYIFRKEDGDIFLCAFDISAEHFNPIRFGSTGRI